MDIFLKYKRLKITVYCLVILNLVLLAVIIARFKCASEPLLFPKKEAFKDVSGILKQSLHLTEQQAEKFNSIREVYYAKEIKLKEAIRATKDAMNEKMFSRDTDDTKIKELAKKTSELEYQMELLRYSQAKELKATCTPEQQEKFEAVIKEIRDYFRPDNQPNRR